MQLAQSPHLASPSADEIRFMRNKWSAELSLYEFLKQGWPYIEGNKEFTDGWHIQAICEHLEAVANRQIRNLLINLPPRCSKSSLVAVAFPAWVWLHNPSEQFLYASYALKLSLRDSTQCRRLIESSWYQKNWGHLYHLEGDQNTKGKFDNTRRGYRIATSVGGSATGEGGSFLICDDPNNAREGESEVKRENTINWYTQVWSTRLNDKKNDCRIVVQQRIHENDVSGYILDNDDLNEWTKLILPMEYEHKRKAKTIVLPSTDGEIWSDPRCKDGQLLWPERIGPKELKSLKNALGSEYAIAGQLQQLPSPATGGIIKKSWFQWWKDTTPPDIEYIVQSWDTALTAKEMSAYSACTTWGVFYDQRGVENVILLSSWRGRVEYPQLREMAKRLFFDYRDTGTSPNKNLGGRRVDLCLIEAKASGDPLIQDLRAAGVHAIGFNPSPYGDKIKRVRVVTHFIESGIVWLPARGPKFDKLLGFADSFIESVACFPNSDSRDLVDTMTQVLLKLREGKFIVHPRDERSFRSSYKKVQY